MNTKLFVGNLSWGVNDDMLKETFEKVGEVVSAKVITDRETHRSRGFGFVEMANEEDAQKAVEELDKTEVDGRPINVNEANENR